MVRYFFLDPNFTPSPHATWDFFPKHSNFGRNRGLYIAVNLLDPAGLDSQAKRLLRPCASTEESWYREFTLRKGLTWKDSPPAQRVHPKERPP